MKLTCPNCGKETNHEIVSYKTLKDATEYVVRCKNCGYTYKKIIKESRFVDLKVIWSWRDKSQVKKYSTLEDAILSVGEEIKVNGVNSLITAIDAGGKRVKKAIAKDIDTLWAKRFDRVIVKISVNRGERTIPYEIVAHPDEEFYIGDIIEVNHTHAVIHRIKTEERFIHRGGARAREIVRIYAKEIREGRRKH